MKSRAFSQTYQGKENWMVWGLFCLGFFFRVIKLKFSVTVSDLA